MSLAALWFQTIARKGAVLGLAASLPLAAGTVGFADLIGASTAHAQSVPGFNEPDPDAQMFMEADELLYNEATNTVTALGRVTIFYDGYTVNADEVIYDRGRERVLARGNVVLVEPGGAVIRATSADLSDTLADGFVDALRVDTPDRTFFTARNATRRDDGTVTEFDSATYTACEACPDNPDRPRAWEFHADTITYDEVQKMVYYRNVRLDFFGVPIAWLPFFAHPDPTVERKTGFLRPTPIQDSDLGFGVSTPYYFALSPSFDFTVTPTAYTTQGLHLQGEWRQRLENGAYSVRASGIRQLDPETFGGQPGDRNFRGSLASNGAFTLNPRWQAGWNLYWQSDRRYFRDYAIESSGASQVVSDIYLTGLHDRSYFDARVERIEVTSISDESQTQPWTLPVVDYDRRFTPDTFGGELRVSANVQGIVRQDSFEQTLSINGSTVNAFEGLEGQSSRGTVDVGWRREFIGPLGQVFTPQVGFRGDMIGYNLGNTANVVFDDGENSFFRGMASAGLEWKWPFLITAPGSTHIVEPVAQFIARPDATRTGEVPIEDSQSLVFDGSNLFEWDKYSGYDQLEGGTRANVGVRYTGTFDNGLSLSGVIGQSFHLAGENPYAVNPTGANILTPNGADSGLETDRSDYVATLTARTQNGFSLTTSGRFDEEDLTLERGEFIGSANVYGVSTTATYAFLAAQPERGINEDHQGVFGSVAFNVTDHWRVASSVRYDIDDTQLMGLGLGIAYNCDCYGVGLQLSHVPAAANEGVSDTRVMMNISLRTIGGVQTEVFGSSSGFGTIQGTD